VKILLVSSRFPLPPWRGNQLRTIQWLDAVGDHERLLVCPDAVTRPSGDELGVETARVPASRTAMATGLAAAVLRGRPAQEGIYDTRAARCRLARAAAAFEPDLVVIQMVRCGWAADELSELDPAAPMLFDAIDCMSLHHRRAASTESLIAKLANRIEARRCRRREGELVRRAVVTTAVSSRDLDALGAGERGMVVPVTGGFETDHPSAATRPPIVLLSGNLGYRPTVRAALRFADKVWPRLWARVPAARWLLAGARPSTGVRRLSALPGVEVHADVDDVGDFLGRARVAIAPMTSGSGVPVKVLEAMAAGVPVVADGWAAAGLVDPTAVAVAGGDDEWVEALHRLLTVPEAAQEQAERGLTLWRLSYHPERVRASIRDAVARAGR
jgi:glycosyltransferase involved in cell wall biosynthesis